MPDDERQITHYVGDACAGGHTEEWVAAEHKARHERLEAQYRAASAPMTEPIDLDAALLRAREQLVKASLRPRYTLAARPEVETACNDQQGTAVVNITCPRCGERDETEFMRVLLGPVPVVAKGDIVGWVAWLRHRGRCRAYVAVPVVVR